MRPLALAIAASVLLLALAPLAAGDHVYSHRYMVRARLLDERGLPVVGHDVEIGSRGVKLDGLCNGWRKADLTTDENGDFEVCLHTHDFPVDAAISLILGDREYAGLVDRETRQSTFLLKVRSLNGSAPPLDWTRRYVVEGMVWQRTAPDRMEDVRVTGVPLPGERVGFSLTSGRDTFEGNATTDGFGQWSVAFNLPTVAGAGNVTVTAAGETRTLPLNLDFMRSRVDFKLDGNGTHPSLDSQKEREIVVAPSFPDNRALEAGVPGEAPPFIGSPAFWFLALVGVGAVAGVLAYRFKR